LKGRQQFKKLLRRETAMSKNYPASPAATLKMAQKKEKR